MRRGVQYESMKGDEEGERRTISLKLLCRVLERRIPWECTSK